MLTKVILDGEFAKVVGQREWMLDCNSPAEAIALIEANKPGIRKWIRQHLDDYKICQVECENIDGQTESLNNDTFGTLRKCKCIRFLPVFTGSGGNNGILQAIAGVAMIIVGVVLALPSGGTSLGLSATGAASLGGMFVGAGVGMVLGAICTMLMKPSKNDDDDDSGSNYYFNGAVNTTTQGNPVPLIFGRCRVGSAVISSEIAVTEG